METETADGTRYELRLPDMIVTSEWVDEEIQPWSGKPCYRYRLRVSAKGTGQTEYMTHAYGSQHDYNEGRNDRAEEMAWMILDDLYSASVDPNEFLSLCFAELDNLTLERVRGVLETIDYAINIADVLETNATEIEDHQ